MKVVINADFGGYSISELAVQRLAELGCEEAKEELAREPVELYPGATPFDWRTYGSHILSDDRGNPLLVQVVEALGTKLASGRLACLEVVEIPDDVEWGIEEYDGSEWVSEKHRTWGR